MKRFNPLLFVPLSSVWSARAPRAVAVPRWERGAGIVATILMTTALTSVAATAAQAGPYCLALRGNGESEPAHWGALANLVEKKGLPVAQSGGSSATISLFLLENIAANPLIATAAPDLQKDRAALLLKSLYGISGYMGQTPESQAGLRLYESSKTGRLEILKNLASGLVNGPAASNAVPPADVVKLVMALKNLGIGHSPRYAFLLEDLQSPLNMLSTTERQKVAFYLGEIKRALSVMGSFDAESDADLFFRDGVINFREFGLGVGKIATLLAGEQWNEPTETAMRSFIETCAAPQRGKTWQELVRAEPRCQDQLLTALRAFFSQNIDWAQANVAFRPVGRQIPSFPTTAVLTKSAYREASAIYEAYHSRLDRSVSNSFRLSHPDDVRLGYWGDAAKLETIATNFGQPFRDGRGRSFDFTQDAKSVRFLPLGPAPWVDVLGLSPAEPGLASLQPMMANGQRALSAGGWSDLHPILLLKASGCDEVVYVTRKGGESLFGQGVAKRVLNLDRSWDVLRTSNEASTKRNGVINNVGDDSDMISLWSRLYNVANPRSSYMLSLASADAVLCTDWNRFDVKLGLEDIVTESYVSPYLVRGDREDLRSELSAAGAKIVTDPYAVTGGEPSWVGCRPPAGF